MKKIIILLLLIIFCLPIFASCWQEYAYKGWYDLSTWKRTDNIVTLWFKDLNPGDWELIKGQKVWYHMAQISANCSSRKIQVLNSTYYNLKGIPIDSYTLTERTYYENGRYYKESNWQDVIPDSIGEQKYKLMCSYR